MHAIRDAPGWVESNGQPDVKQRGCVSGRRVPVTPSPTFAGLNGRVGRAVLFGDLVKFVQQAVEWENLLYFYYPYFWGGEAQGREKMLFEHPDPEHQNFLRAGYCRVVITVRPGFEADFTRLGGDWIAGRHLHLALSDDCRGDREPCPYQLRRHSACQSGETLAASVIPQQRRRGRRWSW